MSDLSYLRQQVGICKEWNLHAIRDNELDGSADYESNKANAIIRKGVIRTHLATLVEELSAAGIYYMPSMFYDLWGLDQDAAVRAAMPGDFPMFGADSLYKELLGINGEPFGVIAATAVRAFLINIATYCDGGSFTLGDAGPKPGPNRVETDNGADLIDAIWDFATTNETNFLQQIGWMQEGIKIWLQNGNGPEDPAEMTLATFMESGYFGDSKKDLKQPEGIKVAEDCGMFVPTAGSEGSAAARDALFFARKQWRSKLISHLAFGDQNPDNVILEQSCHWYWQGTASWQPRLIGNYQCKDIGEMGFSRQFVGEPRSGFHATTNPKRQSVSEFDDADEKVFICVPTGVALVLSANGGETTVTVAANASSTTLKNALLTLPGIGDTGQTGSDLSVNWVTAAGITMHSQFMNPAGVSLYQYLVQFGDTASTALAGNSKSKMKKGPKITVHNDPEDGVVVFRWNRGGDVDRGPEMRAFTKYLIDELGFEVIGPHSPLDSRGPDADGMDSWTAAPDDEPGYNKFMLDADRAREEFIGFAFMNDEPGAAQFMRWLGQMCARRNARVA